MTSVDDALDAVAAAAVLLPTETVDTTAALGRVLAAPVHTADDLPRFDQSAVDGYAVRHTDLQHVPVTLPLGPTVAAAPQPEVPVLAPGHAGRIFTGGLVPKGADTIVRQELTRREDGQVVVTAAVERGTDVRPRGAELRAGALVSAAGAAVTPGLLGALVIAGAHQVTVRTPPRIKVLVTGDEVVPAGAPLGLGQVPDANGPLITAHLARWGFDVGVAEHVADTPDHVRAALHHAFESADLVITSGGVSVGDFDLIPSTCEALGAERVLWKVAQRPGGPLYVARRGSSLLLGLPGNPAAVLVNLHVFVRHVLDHMHGATAVDRWYRGRLAGDVRREPEKTFWLRATATTDESGGVHLHPLGGQDSHMLTNLARADALARVPGGHEAAAVEVVDWLRLDAP